MSIDILNCFASITDVVVSTKKGQNTYYDEFENYLSMLKHYWYAKETYTNSIAKEINVNQTFYSAPEFLNYCQNIQNSLSPSMSECFDSGPKIMVFTSTGLVKHEEPFDSYLSMLKHYWFAKETYSNSTAKKITVNLKFYSMPEFLKFTESIQTSLTMSIPSSPSNSKRTRSEEIVTPRNNKRTKTNEQSTEDIIVTPKNGKKSTLKPKKVDFTSIDSDDEPVSPNQNKPTEPPISPKYPPNTKDERGKNLNRVEAGKRIAAVTGSEEMSRRGKLGGNRKKEQSSSSDVDSQQSTQPMETYTAE